MSNEKYKKYIVEMLEHIEDNGALNRIYEVIHRFFIRREL